MLHYDPTLFKNVKTMYTKYESTLQLHVHVFEREAVSITLTDITKCYTFGFIDYIEQENFKFSNCDTLPRK